MPAASEIAPEKKPQPLQTVDIKDFDRAVEILKQVDTRIPPDVIQKAVQLLFSTYLLPDYDLGKSYIIELPSTNMLALIFPLPDSSHFQMPPPFRKHQNHTWALLHGTTLRTSQLIILEGKIRPANWSYNKNFNRCDMPTFGAFYLGREVSNSDKTFPDWVATELIWTPSKRKEKDNRMSSLGRCIEVHANTLLSKLVAMKWHSSPWLKKEWQQRRRNTRLPTAIMLG